MKVIKPRKLNVFLGRTNKKKHRRRVRKMKKAKYHVYEVVKHDYAYLIVHYSGYNDYDDDNNDDNDNDYVYIDGCI